MSGYLGAGSTDHLSDDGRVFTELYGKIRDSLMKSDTDLTTTVGEFSLAGRPGRSLSKDVLLRELNSKHLGLELKLLARDVITTMASKGLRGNAVSAVSTISNSHLAWKFYYKPIIDSMWAAVDFKLRDRPIRQRVKAKASVSSKSTYTSYPRSEVNVYTTHAAELRYTQLPGTPQQQLMDSFGSMNPALIGWNLLPYSFIVDWFYDVSSYLDALGVVSDSRITDIWLSYLRTTRSTRVYSDSFSNRAGSTEYSCAVQAGGLAKRSTFYRTKIASLPLPYPPVLKMPTVNLADKAITLGEMILQSFLK